MKRHFFCLGSIVLVSVIFVIITSHVNLMKDVSVKKSYIPKSIVAGSLRKPNSSILVLYWSKVFGDYVQITSPEKRHNFPFFSAVKDCPVRCELTTNKSRIGDVSALVIHGGNTEEMPNSPEYDSIPWIFHTNENPVFNKATPNEKIMAKFTYTATYRLDSDFPCPQFIQPSLSKPLPFEKKTGFVVAIYSHCENVRTLYMHRLMKHIRVDSYGNCLRNKPRLPEGFDKIQPLIGKYKFTLVFPNSDCDYYTTEKMFNALSSGSVPVWMGTDKIDEILKWGNLRNAVIMVRDFKSPRKLGDYLTWLGNNKRAYNKFLSWKYEGFAFPKNYLSSPIGLWWEGWPLYCQVCMRLSKDKRLKRQLLADRCDGKQRRTLEKWIRE